MFLPSVRIGCLLVPLFAMTVTTAFSRETPVSVASPVLTGSASGASFTGTVTARREARLSPRVPGLVQAADFEVGDHFEKGETIISLDTTLAEIELKLREAELSLARTERDEARRLFDEAVELGDRALPRSRRLSLENDFKQAEIEVERAEAALLGQRERIRRHRIVAPFPGVVGGKSTEAGEWVETGTPVASFVGDELRLEVRVPQERIEEALSTESVSVQVQGIPDLAIEGTIDALGPSVDPRTRTFLVRIALRDPPAILKPGMSATAAFRSRSDEPVLLIPRDAVIRNEAGEAMAWVLDESGDQPVAVPRDLELGPPRGSRTVVVSGLSAEDRVVVRGNESLREGQAVRVVGATSPREDSRR